MDLASFLGIISGIGLILAAILLGGSARAFVNIPGVMIVMGGTVASTLLTFPIRDVWASFQAAYYVFAEQNEDPNDVVATMIDLTVLSRRKGLLALSRIKTPSQFLHKAVNLVADGSTEDQIRSALTIELEAMKERHGIVQDVFKKMGAYAPAFGMLGTLIGLVQMLSKLDEPSGIGPAMAVALLTTFYGSMMSTLLFLPIAGKLRARTRVEVINLEIIYEGAISILENNNPIMVYEKLSSYVPARKRRPMRKTRLKDEEG
ncbi:MAG: MotA/TolQ/ExbB proton channel family protein [Proteobacteria bacterium]|nr:MotA/TolQ/ExbB proton channel family protein [Pseudomonadota bacterium]